MDRAIFYAALRKRDSGVFGTSLSQGQVNGIEGILDAFVTHGDGREKTLAYALATTVRETGSKMVPVREGFKKTDAEARRYVQRHYGHKGAKWYCWPTGPYGHVYYGRGRVQETWFDNYVETSAETGIDFVKYPDKRLDPVIDAQILFSGLLDGRWNGKGLGIAHYLPDDGPDDLKNARRTVNVLDHWSEIAGYYRAFMKAIEAAGGVPQPAAPTLSPEKPAIDDASLDKALEDAGLGDAPEWVDDDADSDLPEGAVTGAPPPDDWSARRPDGSAFATWFAGVVGLLVIAVLIFTLAKG